MDARAYMNVVGRAARHLARLELRRRTLRAQLKKLEQDIRQAKRDLRLLAQAVEPYTPPTSLPEERDEP